MNVDDFAREKCFHKTLDENGRHDKWCRGCASLAAAIRTWEREKWEIDRLKAQFSPAQEPSAAPSTHERLRDALAVYYKPEQPSAESTPEGWIVRWHEADAARLSSLQTLRVVEERRKEAEELLQTYMRVHHYDNQEGLRQKLKADVARFLDAASASPERASTEKTKT